MCSTQAAVVVQWSNIVNVYGCPVVHWSCGPVQCIVVQCSGPVVQWSCITSGRTELQEAPDQQSLIYPVYIYCMLHCTVCTVLYCKVQCTLYSAQCVLYTVECVLYTVQCVLYTVQCVLYTVQCLLHCGGC